MKTENRVESEGRVEVCNSNWLGSFPFQRSFVIMSVFSRFANVIFCAMATCRVGLSWKWPSAEHFFALQNPKIVIGDWKYCEKAIETFNSLTLKAAKEVQDEFVSYIKEKREEYSTPSSFQQVEVQAEKRPQKIATKQKQSKLKEKFTMQKSLAAFRSRQQTGSLQDADKLLINDTTDTQNTTLIGMAPVNTPKPQQQTDFFQFVVNFCLFLLQSLWRFILLPTLCLGWWLVRPFVQLFVAAFVPSLAIFLFLMVSLHLYFSGTGKWSYDYAQLVREGGGSVAQERRAEKAAERELERVVMRHRQY